MTQLQNYLLAYILPLQQDRCVEVIRSARLKAWVEAPYSGFLVINDNERLQFRSPALDSSTHYRIQLGGCSIYIPGALPLQTCNISVHPTP